MKWLLLILFIVVVAARLLLRRLNLRYLMEHGHEVPEGFQTLIDGELLAKSSDYTEANSRLGLVESLCANLLLALFLFGGLLAWYDRWIVSLTDSFIGQGVFFITVLMLVQTILDVPFSLYRTFVLEERFQFNTSTPRIWLTDLIKSLGIGLLLLALLTSGALALVQSFPESWWLWVWALFTGVSVLLMFLSPVLIEPLFFKFRPLQNEQLAARVKEVMARAGLRIDRVQEVDASRRSKHSNAYFTGIGRVKRIVLFDTLLDQMDDDEIIAILAHEAGHWKLGHIWKRLLLMATASLAICWLAWQSLAWGGLPAMFGLQSLSFTGQVLLLGFLAGLAGFPLTPISSALSRHHEWQADRFSLNLTGHSEPLARALVKLSRENLSNLHPHPLYAWFYYSHPPVVMRVARLFDGGNPT